MSLTTVNASVLKQQTGALT
uniref:Uncharacterized protein n=1 Tax=Anguilla anguilla TaxID=7936 RepID=A0A0E9XZB5_ANGAN